MTDVTVYGFPISTCVNVVRLVLTHKEVPFEFHDLEGEMGGPSDLALQPTSAKAKARMNQWIGALNGYYYPNIAFHLGHERPIYPTLGIAPDEKVVAVALPRISTGLEAMERELDHGRPWLVDERPTLADFFMLPTLTTLSLTPEGHAMLADKPRIAAWRQQMEGLPSVAAVQATVMPHLGKPVEHARRWVDNHRPRY